MHRNSHPDIDDYVLVFIIDTARYSERQVCGRVLL